MFSIILSPAHTNCIHCVMRSLLLFVVMLISTSASAGIRSILCSPDLDGATPEELELIRLAERDPYTARRIAEVDSRLKNPEETFKWMKIDRIYHGERLYIVENWERIYSIERKNGLLLTNSEKRFIRYLARSIPYNIPVGEENTPIIQRIESGETDAAQIIAFIHFVLTTEPGKASTDAILESVGRKSY